MTIPNEYKITSIDVDNTIDNIALYNTRNGVGKVLFYNWLNDGYSLKNVEISEYKNIDENLYNTTGKVRKISGGTNWNASCRSLKSFDLSSNIEGVEFYISENNLQESYIGLTSLSNDLLDVSSNIEFSLIKNTRWC